MTRNFQSEFSPIEIGEISQLAKARYLRFIDEADRYSNLESAISSSRELLPQFRTEIDEVGVSRYERFNEALSDITEQQILIESYTRMYSGSEHMPILAEFP